MNKFFQTILTVSLIALGLGIFCTTPALAQSGDLTVKYWSETSQAWSPLSGPLFNEVSFAPGDSVIRLARVTNNSGSTQKIAVETINENNPDHLAERLNFTIKQGETVLYNDTLANFFVAGEKYLSDLVNGAQTQYDFIITFDAGANDDYQGKTLGFDIIIGFQGTEGGPISPSQGGSGGGVLPPGLTIVNQSNSEIEETSVTITWDTSYAATSQVIYSTAAESHTLNLNDNTGMPPTYGYAHTTPEYDVSPRVTSHSVTITGLAQGTTYYYRAVSHGSLAISEEYSFVTKGVAGVATTVSETEETAEEVGGGTTPENTPPSGGGQGILPENSGGLSAGTTQGAEGGAIGETVNNNEGKGGNAQNSWLAAIGGIPLGWRILLLILIVVGLILLIMWLIGRRRKKRTKTL
ncbi:MAG: fibronectin type III domain-containing protein [Candidatus Paceibacterota bacterium]